MDAAPTLRSVLGHVPILPLPAAVLFPGIVLPLQLVAPQDCELVEDVLAGPQHLVLSMLPPQPRARRPTVCAVGCVARLMHAQRTDRGHYDVLLEGVERVSLLEEVPSTRAYRCFRAELLPTRPAKLTPPSLQADLARLQRHLGSLRERVARVDPQLVAVLQATDDPLRLVDLLAAVLIGDPAQQQRVLATCDLQARLQQVTAAVAAALLKYGPSREAAAGRPD